MKTIDPMTRIAHMERALSKHRADRKVMVRALQRIAADKPVTEPVKPPYGAGPEEWEKFGIQGANWECGGIAADALREVGEPIRPTERVRR